MKLFYKIKFYIGNIFRFLATPFFEYTIHPKDACTIFGARFHSGWHHIIETLKQYDENHKINYKDTIMYSFLSNFIYKSFTDFINEPNEKKLEPFMFPWGPINIGLDINKKSLSKSRFCGPSTNEFIKDEFERTIKLYEKIKDEGYKPYSFGNSFIIGTWLISNENKSVFMVLGGNHRMAILSHLGFKKVKVRTSKKLFKKIKEEEINSWHLVKSQICSFNHAKKVFNLFFKENGNHLKKIIKT